MRLCVLLRGKIRENLTAESHVFSIEGKKLQRFDSEPKNNHVGFLTMAHVASGLKVSRWRWHRHASISSREQV
jgi:hypothetical protein